jgi:RNA polymerase sigma factor (sigma-70 family)
MSDDAALLRRYAEDRSEAAFAELVRRHLNLVYAVALRQCGGDAHLAQDVAQRVFTDLARKAAALASRPVLSGWLHRATQFAATDVVRAERRRRAREQEAHAMQELTRHPGAEPDWDRLRPVLDQAVNELGERDRDAVMLRFYEGRAFADIGVALRLSEDAARMRVDRALDKLRGSLAKRGVTSTAAALAAVLADQAGVAAPAGLAATVTGAALAGAITVGAPAAILAAFFMNKTIVALTTAALVGVGSAVYAINQNLRAEAALAALAQERDTARIQLRDTQKLITQAEQKSASLQRNLDSLLAAKTASSTSSRGSIATGGSATPSGSRIGFTSSDGVTQWSRPFVNDAQGRTALRAEAYDIAYAAFFRQLGFTPEQREQFKALLNDRMERGQRLIETMVAQGNNPDKLAVQVIFDQTDSELQTELHAAFGDKVVDAYNYFEASRPVRFVADQLASALFYSDAPLTVTQADQLVEIMAGNARDARGKVAMAALNLDAALAQAQGVLSAAQLEQFRRIATKAKDQPANAGSGAANSNIKPSGG